MNWLRDLSLILLATEVFIATLLPLIVFGGLVYGLWWLLRHENLPTWIRIVQAYLALGLAYVQLVMQAIARPVFAVHTAIARLQGIMGAMTDRSGRTRERAGEIEMRDKRGQR